jgi:hypothetical protein
MTGQVHDIVVYQNQGYSLIGVKGSGWLIPADFGIETESDDTGCWRGYVALYKIIDNKLFLDAMSVFGKTDPYPVINGEAPILSNGSAVYKNLLVAMAFSGQVRLATDFRRECYVHMGFQKASASGIVLDLTFEHGGLIDVEDRSAEMEAKRGAFKKLYEANPFQYIDLAFSLDIDIE